MRSLLATLALFLPMAVGLWYLSGGEENVSRLPAQAPAAEEPAVIVTEDFADEDGRAPFRGKLRRLSDLVVRVQREGYVQYYLRIGRVARREGEPRIESITCALFDPPKDGRPQLRMTFHAPSVLAKLADLVRSGKDAARVVTLTGGVEARDAAGRTVAEVERVTLDLVAQTATSDGPVAIHLPERRVTIRGVGLFAEVKESRIRLRRDVVATILDADGRPVRFGCLGAATVSEIDEGRRFEIDLTGGANIDHPLGRADCARILARVEKDPRTEKFDLTGADLDGGVVLELRPDAGRGLRTVRVPRVKIVGRESILCLGKVDAVWVGPVHALGIGERTIDVTAGNAALLLAETDKGKLEVGELRFADGFRAVDRNGAGTLAAANLTYAVERKTLAIFDKVRAKTQDGTLACERLDVTWPGKDRTTLVANGVDSIEYFAQGRLEPLGEAREGVLRVTCAGPLQLTREGKRVTLAIDKDVVATIGDSRLSSNELSATVDDGKLNELIAAGKVALAARDLELDGDKLVYAGEAAVVTGAPAHLRMADGRLVKAKRIQYTESGAFVAEEDVFVRAYLKQGREKGAWEIRCARAAGTLGEGGRPQAVTGEGALEARGPDGVVVKGARFTYNADSGKATLTGAPATVRRAKDLDVVAEGFELELERGEVKRGRTLGGSTRIELKGKADDDSFRRWEIELAGEARLEGERVLVPGGARLTGYDRENRPVLRARAGEASVRLVSEKGRWRPAELVGGKGVEVVSTGKEGRARVTGERLRYEPGTRKVDLFGNALVEAEGWPNEVRFRHIVFLLTKDGIDLKRASEIEVRERRQ